MRLYLAFIKLKIKEGIQYRANTVAGIMTQFFWGFIEITIFTRLIELSPVSEITRNNLATFIWLRQALFSFTAIYREDTSIYKEIQNGDIAYQLTKPMSIYSNWFSRNLAHRLVEGLKKALPLFIICPLLNEPYRMGLAKDYYYLIIFLISLIFTILISIVLSMVPYAIAILTINFTGFKNFYVILIDMLQGAYIPIFFYPLAIRRILELLPTGNGYYISNRIYYGDFSYSLAMVKIGGQIFNLLIIYILTKLLIDWAIKRLVIQGG